MADDNVFVNKGSGDGDGEDDELARILGSKFEVSSSTSLASCNPKFQGLFKDQRRHSEESRQEDRRRQFLAVQKEKRDKILLKFRDSLTTEDVQGIAEEFMEDGEGGEEVNPMDCSASTTTHQGKKPRHYRNFLMMSEWMMDVPMDLLEKWILVICPIGKRCLVVSSGGKTRAFARNGYEFLSSFPSLLPSGRRGRGKRMTENSMLDCIYVDRENTFYVLDIILWNGLSFFGCDTDFRFYWLHNKFEEELLNDQKEKGEKLSKSFSLLPHFNCDNASISTAIATSESSFASGVDGLLFFHREALYISGVTPLILWLKTNMVSDMLGVKIDTLGEEEKASPPMESGKV